MSSAHYLRQTLHLKRNAFILVLAWSFAIFLVYVWHTWDRYENTLESAQVQAIDSFEKDLVYRRWAAMHGGVYVPPTEETPANPYLSHIENRDITATSGLNLTLMNPAYMTRQVHELVRQQYGHQGRITSLNPLRPENAPDVWETKALKMFANGVPEVVELVDMDGSKYMRLMRPLTTEANCLKCHAGQGYQVGDQHGGISVSVPMAPQWAIMKSHMIPMTLGYVLLWLLGLGGIAFGSSRLELRLRDHEQAGEALRESESRYRLLVENVNDIIWLFDLSTQRITFSTPSAERIVGYTPEELTTLSMEECYTPESVEKLTTAMMEGLMAADAGQEVVRQLELQTYHKDGSLLWLEISARLLPFENGIPKYVLGVSRDITERKQAEEELRQFECIVSSSTDMMALLDKGYTYLAANDAYRNAFGKSKEEIIGHSVPEIFGEDLFKTVIRPHAERCMTGQVVHFSNWVEFPASGRQYMDIAFSPYFGVDQEVRGFVVNGRNITDRMKAEEALKENEALLRSIFVAAPVGIGLTIHRVFNHVNDRVCEMTGYDNDELIGKNARMLYLSDEDYENVGKEKYAQIDKKNVGTVQTQWQRKDGRVIDVLLSSSPVDPSDRSLGVTFSVLDITDRKQAEEKLLESEKRFRMLVESLPGGLIAHNLVGDILMVNEATCQNTGYTREELTSMNAVDIDPTIVTREDREKIWLSLNHGENTTIEAFHIRKDGSRYPVEIALNAIVLGGEPAILGVLHDISDRKHAEEEKAKLEDQLRQSQKMESIGRLAGGVAHDFNNILTGINGYAEMIISSLEPDDPLRADMDEIFRAGERAAGLTNQLLAFSRKQVIAPRIISPNKILSNSQNMLRRIIGEDIDLVFAPGDGLGFINADPAQLDQVLVNLAVNARDAMPGGGRLTISTSNTTIDEKFCGLHPEAMQGNYVMLSVTDTGCGMDEETIQNIFEPFFSTKSRDQGTGLGLATVYGIIKQNNGFISVNSKLEAGTTFNVYYPRVEEIEEDFSSNASNEIPKGDETVLLVEDEDMVRGLAKKLLERQGYTVIEACSGEDALDLCDQYVGQIHLLLTDVIMPGMNGRQLQEKLLESKPELKALFMSGYTEDTIAHHGVLDPQVNFIQKPFAIEALARQVRSALDG